MPDIAGARVSLAGLGALTGTATTAASGGLVTVDVGGITAEAGVLRGVSVAAGDVVLVTRQGAAWWVLGRLYAAAPTPPSVTDPAPAPKPATVDGLLVCAPVETRSYRGGKWRTDTDDVLQGVYAGYPNNTGCAFYGAKPRSLAGATVLAARLAVRRIRAGAFASTAGTLRLVTQATRPAGAPTLGASTAGPALAVGRSTTAFAVPTSWAQAMVDGTAGGLAVFDADGSPYLRYAGRAGWSAAWTLSISWRR